MRYFAKTMLNHYFAFNGQRVLFERVGNDEGVRQLDETADAALVAELDRAADVRRGGIRRISFEVYEGAKKNMQRSLPSPNLRNGLPPIRVHNPESLLPKSNVPRSSAESAGAVIPTAKAATPPVGAPATTLAQLGFAPHRGRKSAAERAALEGLAKAQA